jgi:hypothetical protein
VRSAKEHYEEHLGRFYEWMCGPFDTAQKSRQEFYERHAILPSGNGVAVDLGCGHGIDTVSLLNLGFRAIAFDFNKNLLASLEARTPGRELVIVHKDFRDFKEQVRECELVVCMGDTIAHLDSVQSMIQFLHDCFAVLSDKGRLVLSFRDYSVERTGTGRFIPVRSDDDNIHACMLEYSPDHVTVTDLHYERSDAGWSLHTGEYRKLRLSPGTVREALTRTGFSVIAEEENNGMHSWVCVKMKRTGR